MRWTVQYMCVVLVILGLSLGNTASAQDAGPVLDGMTSDMGPLPNAEQPATTELPSLPPPVSDEISMIRKAYYGVTRGDNKWRALAALVLIGLVYVTRRYGGKPVPVINVPLMPPRLYAWFCTDRGGVVLVFLVAAMGALGHALAADVALSEAVVENAVMVGVSAAGAYVTARRLATPADKKEGSS